MAYYVAKYHVRLHGYTARPGEVIEEALEEDSVQRLLGLGAIEPVGIPEDVPKPTEQGDIDGDDQYREEADSDEWENPEAEDAPAVEIDVMDGISPAACADPAQKPSKRTSRSGGKTK